MSSAGFQDRLERLLAGELSEEEFRQFFLELQKDPQALEDYLAVRELHHDLGRLLSPGSSDEAFLRGILNARSGERKKGTPLSRIASMTNGSIGPLSPISTSTAGFVARATAGSRCSALSRCAAL